jgi:drug/metabolite transporter (DMT)-like permease
MGLLLALVSAVCYGTSDFVAGVGGRRGMPSAVTMIAQPFGLLAALAAVALLPSPAPTSLTLWWGALSGVGSGVGTIALYRGLARGQMSVVAPLSAVLAAALPALVGVLIGDRLSVVAWVGIAIALPSIVLVTVRTGAPLGGAGSGGGTGIGYGLVAGTGFAMLFIGLARAGTRAGAWPLVLGQLLAVAIVAGVFFIPTLRPDRADWSPSLWFGVSAGVLAGLANLAYLTATGHAQLTVVAVLTALYPAVTVVLARLVLHERWDRLQAAGLLAAAAAVAMITAG